jgi:hypothetical protein
MMPHGITGLEMINLITSNIRLTVQTRTLMWISQFLLFKNFPLLKKVHTEYGVHQAS